MGLIAQALVVLLAAGPDAGFEAVVLDVNHGSVFTNLSDGGVSDAPTIVIGGTWMDDATTSWVAQNKAEKRGELSVGPQIDVKTLTVVGAVLFVVGLVTGATLVLVYKR